MATREEFAKKLAELEACFAAGHELQARYDREVKEAWDAARAALPPKRSRKKRSGEDEDPLSFTTKNELSASIRERYQALADEIPARVQAVKEALRELAATIKPVAGELVVDLDEIWVSTYNSQGYGAVSYAKGAAEMRADIARVAGIPVEVVEESRPYNTGIPSVDRSGVYRSFHVVVRVLEDLDLQILKYSPSPSLRESVRLCWARGVNPRVYNPWLPYGYEKKEGLDYHGRDLRDPKRGQPKVPSEQEGK